jgi:DNA gyrase/topoisomerase IV subunit B
MRNQEIIQLSDRDHIILRPNLYLGAVDETTSNEFVLTDGKLIKKEITYVPGLLKIINEILDNSIDEAVRTQYQHGTRIKVDIKDGEVTIEDNGRGIPVKKAKGSNQYMPVLAFCEARAGSNFKDDEGRETIGMNGVGAALTNVYSTKFSVETADGKNKLILTCTDNLSTEDYTVRKSSASFTRVKFTPDYPRFGVDTLGENHIAMLHQRLIFLSVAHPEIKFYLNKELIQVNTEKKFLEMFSDDFELFKGSNWFVGVFPNPEDDFSFFSYVNGLHISNGGNHIDNVAWEISIRLRDRLQKKYKSIKPGDVKNKLSVVVFFNGFKNMKFASQTKDKLTNSVPDIKAYMNLEDDFWDKATYRISRNSAIMEPIIELFRIKEEFKKRQELKNMSKSKKRIVSDKYYPPIKSKKYLFLSEGDSANGGIMPVFGRKDIGYFALKGKPLNTTDIKISRLAANKEIQTIVDILDLDLTNPNTDMEYEWVVFASDQDADGFHIRALLLAFFNRFTPKLLKEGRISFLSTPLVVGKKASKISKWFFNFEDYQNCKDKLEWRYYKGLGSFKKKDLQEIVELSGGLEKLLTSFQVDEGCINELEVWMKSENADSRKDRLRDRSFNISTI